MAFDSGRCAGTSGISVLPNTNGTVCGIRSLQANLKSCCGDAAIQTYQCQQYCSTSSNIRSWHQCMGNTNTSAIADIFCQGDIVGNNTETLQTKTSYAASSPRISSMLVFLTLMALLFASVDATTIPSLNSNIARRQSTLQVSCSIDIARNYTTTRNNTIAITGDMGCESNYCEYGIDVDTGILNNNRTINGASAAGTQYDAFFDLIQNKTGHWFPALSKTTLKYSFLAPIGTFRVNFTPFAYCIDGTATGCGDVLGGTNGSTPVIVCGPDFVTEPTASSLSTASIQGVLSLLVGTSIHSLAVLD